MCRMDPITHLNFDSEPGRYEVEVENDLEYELELPQDFLDTAAMIISRESGIAENFEERNALTLYSFRAVIGEPAQFTVDSVDGETMKNVATHRVVAIRKIC